MRILGVTASSFELYGAYESIASATGTGSSATITFSSIPGTYQHLQLRFLGRNTGTGTVLQDVYVQINGNTTSSNYAYHGIYGDGTTAATKGVTNLAGCYVESSLLQSGGTSGALTAGILDIHDYASTTKNKTLRWIVGSNQNNATATNQSISLYSGLFAQTGAITSLSIITASNSWSTNSTFALYGIKGG